MPVSAVTRKKRYTSLQALRKLAREAGAPLCEREAGQEVVRTMARALLEGASALTGPRRHRAQEAFDAYEATFQGDEAAAGEGGEAAGGDAGEPAGGEGGEPAGGEAGEPAGGEAGVEAGEPGGGDVGEEPGGAAGEEADVEATEAVSNVDGGARRRGRRRRRHNMREPSEEGGEEAAGEGGPEAGEEAHEEAGDQDDQAAGEEGRGASDSSSGTTTSSESEGPAARAEAKAKAKAKAASRAGEWKFKATGLTYNHTRDDWASTDTAVLERLFNRFVVFFRALGEQLDAKGLTAKMERSASWTGEEDAHVHLHGYLHLKKPFHKEGPSALECFHFVDGEKTHRPHLENNTASGRTYKGAVHHGHCYLAVDKVGSLFVWTNFPPFKAYGVEGWWLDNWLKQGKLTREAYLKWAARVTVGFQRRLTDVRAAERYEMELAAKELASEEARRVAPLRKTIVQFPEIARFLGFFGQEGKERRPMLAIVGATGLGKSLLAAAVLESVGAKLGLQEYLEVTVENSGALDLSDLDVRRHAGVLLDGVGDALLLKENREALQGRPKLTKGGRSATMMYAYRYTLARRAVVVTLDLSAANLGALVEEHPGGVSDHWLTDERNLIVLWLEGRQTWNERAPLAPPRPILLGGQPSQRRRLA